MKHHHQLRHQKKSKGNNKKQALKFCSRYSVFFSSSKWFFHSTYLFCICLSILYILFVFLKLPITKLRRSSYIMLCIKWSRIATWKKKKQQPRIEEKKICIHQRNEKMGKYWNVRSNVCTHMREMFYAKQCTLNYSFDIFFFGLHRRKIE